MPKTKDKWEYGDFQTPRSLADEVCHWLHMKGITPASIIEPTCGEGRFLEAAWSILPRPRHLVGFDINEQYVRTARIRLENAEARIEQGDFFSTDWRSVLHKLPEPVLVLGNPPWVTSSELGLLQSMNLPKKSNFQKHAGFDALTGKSNFDISEWMVIRYFEWLWKKHGFIAVLCKSSVARKLLRQMWSKAAPIKRAEIVKIDAFKNFGASVDACLFFVEIAPGGCTVDADVYTSFASIEVDHTLGIHDGVLVADVETYLKTAYLRGKDPFYTWRSGVKHDCSRVMELDVENGHLVNRLGEKISIEDSFLYPLIKSSDIGNSTARTPRKMVIVPQKNIREDTIGVKHLAPRTWRYLEKHASLLDRRGSSIYRGKPRFSIFGVGHYTFAPYKVVISGFYKNLQFKIIEPFGQKAVVPDDTINFLPAFSAEEANFLADLLNSSDVQAFFESQIFWEEKRPITVDLLKRLSIQKAAQCAGREREYVAYTERSDSNREDEQMLLSIVGSGSPAF